jgi:hypothetical protein
LLRAKKRRLVRARTSGMCLLLEGRTEDSKLLLVELHRART